jgi:hypothetical protein
VIQSRTSWVFGSENSNSRLAKFWNWKFTLVNDQLQGKRNEEVGLSGQTLIILLCDKTHNARFGQWLRYELEIRTSNGTKIELKTQKQQSGWRTILVIKKPLRIGRGFNFIYCGNITG